MDSVPDSGLSTPITICFIIKRKEGETIDKAYNWQDDAIFGRVVWHAVNRSACWIPAEKQKPQRLYKPEESGGNVDSNGAHV